MTRIHIHLPDGTTEEPVALPAGAALLVGRDPDPETGSEPLGTLVALRRLPIASPLVSSNHVLLWSNEAGLHARDLHSKNGTYLRLGRGEDVSLPGSPEAHFFLAGPQPLARTTTLREVAVLDTDPAVFASHLKDAVGEWLLRSGLSPALSVVGADSRTSEVEPALDDSRFTIPLVEGLALEIADAEAGRTRARWDSIKAELFPYAYDQVGRWRACRAARTSSPLAFRSPGAARALREVLEAARSRLPLILHGETGTGKTALAAIYAGRESLRPSRGGKVSGSESGRPFVTVHCAHLDPPLAHSTLFGALKGSYTSSERTVIGAVKLADGGVLFLDDVDALPLLTQAKLLRFLDDGEYEPLGHGQRDPLIANVRVVTGTNVDLRAAVRERRFREDLYWRLHMGMVVRVPPLRDRPEDIEQLLGDSPGDLPPNDGGEWPRFPQAGVRAVQPAPGRSVRDRLDGASFEYLVHRHPWRGNFRECLRFCARVRMEPASRPLLDRRRCEEILAEASLDAEEPTSLRAADAVLDEADSAFERALRQAVRWWMESEGSPPERFDELGRFCESYLKSSFVAHTLDLADAHVRPESFDRERRQRLGCDLTTLKRKMDEYLTLRKGSGNAEPRNAGE